MRPIDDPLPQADVERFDLLADGELSEPERRDLLQSLDDTPDGWRRCALAFLESQSWRQQMPAIRDQGVSESPAPGPVGRSSLPRSAWGTLLAMAACFFVALGLVLAVRSFWTASPAAGPPKMTVGSAEGPDKPGLGHDPTESLPAPDTPGGSWELVTLPVAGDQRGEESIQVWARQSDRLDERWPEDFRSAMPPRELLEALRESGHQIRQRRRLLPVPMEDGRQLVVPLQQFEVEYVGSSAFQ
ncbi:MAG: hypothetical protein ACYTG0_00300 [Planctomycetota bacterium]|jgi:hypothetical protein